ncbi:nicotinate-nucleotide--dimethylbenzimidazole phosphoribosyltransferase [Corynebacterium sp. zg912]|uniref:Nicotinate-nucleotide--dimethylbenzimidazole phosphoribosyltransferase n=1 Tax=Corynebacterium wankanglinii TaxID=2735136 RepID=A0A7H0K962_9CORY|nr:MULTISPECIES: nicotinate-nucleotide--dimethylbenzimidazole phosphoribosyltransferase [Corynebacterium]MBA1837288.1 nicotinate-nucleotide--dimethylbenzimidazole phosphoribosyltransferase [Corynebacterium wankanglinii]MCR5928263.1 nicotinate-nucleotide--dimethylbenzimidazole phosphoribosyltransferase [Corynebacterium sp. zg912]QNP93828.1 nicotinate-nucleotide--dimethylbenzimidazole phosphoribosyltransferase [Corynebacterium wankanglinii]
MHFPPVEAPAQSHRHAVADALAESASGLALGRLGSLAAWIAAVQGTVVPKPFSRARAIIVAGNHGIAERGLSAWTADAGAAQANELRAGGGPGQSAARVAGASVRLIGDYLDAPTGAIDVESAVSSEVWEAALAAGAEVADNEIDAGADLIVAGDIGVGNTTVAAAVYGTLTRTEPVKAIGRGSGINDKVWKIKSAAVRDAMFRVRNFRDDTPRVCAELTGPDFAFLVGLIAQSAARRTPVLVGEVYPTMAAYVAERLAPGTKEWLIAGQATSEPAHTGCLEALNLKPVMALDMKTGQGAGALAALPQLNLAAELAGEVLAEGSSRSD